MYQIVVFLVGALSGQPIAPPIVVAQPSFDTVEACETERNGDDFKSAVEDLKKALAEKLVEANGTKADFDIKTVCAKLNDKPAGRSAAAGAN